MSMSMEQIMRRQNEVLEAMAQVRSMRRGNLSQQTYPHRAKRKNGKGAVGPYGLWQGTFGGKHFSKRVSGDEAQRVEKDIARRREFEVLCDEYVELSCQLAALKCENKDRDEALKKGLKSRSKKTRKFSASSK